MKKALLLLSLCISLSAAHAQFAPQVGVSGSTAIKADSNIIVAWATGCQVQRGYRDIAVPDSGYASSGVDNNGVGPMDHSIISLGDSGVATLTFAAPVNNGPGPDFAVFENGFADPGNPEMAFLEFAFVEVSSNGTDFYRFPAACYIPDTAQVPVAGVYVDARMVNNLAGKYISGYGTPFDLDILAGNAGLDVDHVTHIRLVDAIGSLGAHASLDTGGRKINDPYPTNIPTSGFDLDAVGVIHQAATGLAHLGTASAIVYPNPVTDRLIISIQAAGETSYTLTDMTGRILQQGNTTGHTTQLAMSAYAPGLYCLTFIDNYGNKWIEKVTKR